MISHPWYLFPPLLLILSFPSLSVGFWTGSFVPSLIATSVPAPLVPASQAGIENSKSTLNRTKQAPETGFGGRSKPTLQPLPLPSVPSLLPETAIFQASSSHRHLHTQAINWHSSQASKASPTSPLSYSSFVLPEASSGTTSVTGRTWIAPLETSSPVVKQETSSSLVPIPQPA